MRLLNKINKISFPQTLFFSFNFIYNKSLLSVTLQVGQLRVAFYTVSHRSPAGLFL